MNSLHDRPQEPERSYNRAYWESLNGDNEPDPPFTKVPKCVQKRREDELRSRDEETAPKEEAKVLPVRNPNSPDSQYSKGANRSRLSESEIRDIYE